MHSFKDNADRAWEIRINVGTIKRVRGRLKYADGTPLDLSTVLNDGFKGFGKLLSDIVLFVDILFVLCEDQAGKLGVSDVEFGESLAGDGLAAAVDAFREELVDFFPDSKARMNLRNVMEKSRQLGHRMMDRSIAKLEVIDLDKEAERMISSMSSTLTPES